MAGHNGPSLRYRLRRLHSNWSLHAIPLAITASRERGVLARQVHRSQHGAQDARSLDRGAYSGL